MTSRRRNLSSLRVHVVGLDWSSVKTEKDFKGVLHAAQANGYITQNLRLLWEDFYDNYKAAVLGSKIPKHDEKFVVQVQASIAEKVFDQLQEPYIFPSYHQRVLEPINYYEFGQKYVGSLVDFDNSFIGHLERWKQISRQLEAGENVVLLANHQTEADPGVFAHLIGSVFPKMAEDVIYVAGDRVITDPLCKPFSMGRNLFCVYSKRHIDDVPEEKEAKTATNRKTLVTMARQLNKGGLLLWIAPSGGRDRPKENGKWTPNTFDPTSVELMRKLLSKSRNAGHLYAMGMVSWKMMPPPIQIEEAIGERRETNFVGVGISVSSEIDVEDVVKDCNENDVELKQKTLADFARDEAEKEFLNLEEVINNPESRSKYPAYSQPWLKQVAEAT